MLSIREIISIFVVFAAVIIILLIPECANPAQAQKPWPTWDEASKLKLAKCVFAECTANTPEESAAIAHVLVKTWRDRFRNRGWTVDETIEKYCAVFDKGGQNYYRARTQGIRESTWETPLYGRQDQWEWLRDFVDRFAQRKVDDPCPAATTWRGRTDIKKPEWTCPCKYTERGNEFCHVQK